MGVAVGTGAATSSAELHAAATRAITAMDAIVNRYLLAKSVLFN